ncbi:Uncharacterised protein [Neisseria zoodegmatis]|uniref:Uncharacterized protein n=1 Tax=Neisseria zoodegmatis TaxID=326523 RepID=A0A378WFJ1_9NEIS|nr:MULTISPECIES: hypothetical protein [Neisseria]UOO85519.1 hypothetical protein LVJ88_06030 [Neisseria dumasiana]SUA35802.1 Uncharacterised protein [Neisseria zoodegmatis]
MKKGYYLKLSIVFVVLSVINFVVVHKPNSTPYLGYFFAVAAVVAFVLHLKKG